MSKYGIEKDNVVKAANESYNMNRKTQNLDENPDEIIRSSYEKVFKTAKESAKRVTNVIENTLTSQFTPSEGQRRRTAVFVGDRSIEIFKSMQNISASNDEISIPNGQSTQQRMNIIGDNQVVTTSRSNQHRTFYQAPSPRDYESLMKLCEACNFYNHSTRILFLDEKK
ncbi:8670_t:CDS:2 [Ambispora leptoticha]|uniref:8670_t:CDS:1 n=1 Tax=Ambispora leptoticha TaxID=144679 RepID=A0A9N9BL49_9GLOM|nr:8670_t:CDS:2 [Ambispora leptoticha]